MKKNIVFTAGVFDLPHPGHLMLLEKASKLGKSLIVGLQSDESVLEQKGRAPILDFKQRALMIKSFPFIKQVVSYRHDEYIKVLQKVNPDIVVQGGDWYNSGDRMSIMEFIKENSIEFIQFPYTTGISTSEIKRRIVDSIYMDSTFNYPLNKLFKGLSMISIDELSIYEKYDDLKVKKLKKIISDNKIFQDPIVVGKVKIKNKKLLIVIDGANRLEALKRLGATSICCYVVNYFNDEEVRLLANRHFLKIEKNQIKKIFDFKKWNLNKSTYINGIAQLKIDDKEYLLKKSGSVQATVQSLNDLVASYKSKYMFVRLSEVDNLFNADITISFVKFSKSEIVNLIIEKILLESGITWHKLNYSLIRLNLPLKMLFSKNIQSVNDELKNLIARKEKMYMIRRYSNPVVLFDEWKLSK